MEEIKRNSERRRTEKFDDRKAYWFVMRDRTPVITKQRAYQTLSNDGFEVFVPLQQKIKTEKGRRVRVEVPVIPDLLFVHSTKEILDPIVKKASSFRFRYAKGNPVPMYVGDKAMQQFIDAVKSSTDVQYYSPEEITPSMYGHKVRVMGGTLKDKEGYLLATRGGNCKKRFLLELPGLLAATVVVEKEHIQLI